MYGVVDTSLSLEEYWEFLQITECYGYGIRNVPAIMEMNVPADISGCDVYWNQSNRYWMANAINKTELRIGEGRWLGFPLRRTYEANRQVDWASPVMIGRRVRGIGVESETTIGNAALTLSVGGVPEEPVTFTIGVDFTDENELMLRYPAVTYPNAGQYHIRPSSVVIAANVATVQIPRCRLLKPEFYIDYQNDQTRPDYETDANFMDAVTVVRNRLDTSGGATLVWRYDPTLCGVNVGGTTQTAYADIHDQVMGEIKFIPATYAAGSATWTAVNYTECRFPDHVQFSNMRGLVDRYEPIETSIQRAVIAVAHTNVPQEHCACSVQNKYFDDDNRELSPPVRLGLGASKWGIYEATEIIREFRSRFSSYRGGLLC